MLTAPRISFAKAGLAKLSKRLRRRLPKSVADEHDRLLHTRRCTFDAPSSVDLDPRLNPRAPLSRVEASDRARIALTSGVRPRRRA
jgi:hypothetical protein